MNKIIKQINELEETIKAYSQEQMKNKTIEFKEKIKSGTNLEEILPEAFAMVREATRRITGKRLYDVQLMGGYVLEQGRIAEIKAGEGKTLTAGLPAYLNALEEKGVHVITTNEYLAKRDYQEVGKILEYLGLTVGLIEQKMGGKARKEAYQKDVTYGTNTEFGFDYLRDNIANDKNYIVQRELNYAIIDEADSILIDEAQTPMIISQKKYKIDEIPYIKANEFVRKLRGTEVIKEEPKNKKQQEEIEKYDYVIDKTYKTVELTQKGIEKAEKEYKLKNLYNRKNADIINKIKQALRANTILKKDVDYIVQDKKILLIDSFTGRIMYGKRYTRGLHEAIEAKENLKIEESSEMMANITTQNYFRMYKKLAGMTGTAKSAEKEFEEIYKLDVVKIPTNKKIQRIDKKDKIYKTEEEKNLAIIEEIKKSKEKGQPVLIGTISIEKSENLGKILDREKIEYQILNAKNHEQEAEIVKHAGELGKVTIATNMAGRGTNIILGGEEVIKAGGLKVIGTEKHEAKRIDEQLRGRSGRQGQIGESIFYLSLEDDIVKIYGNRKNMYDIDKAQKRAENRNYTIRKRLVYYDEILNKQRQIIYKERRQLLEGQVEATSKKFISYFCEQILEDNSSEALDIIQKLEEAENMKIDKQNIEELKKRIYKTYDNKKIEIGEKFEKIEKNKMLMLIDEYWIEHLEIMEELKDNIELRVYGGHNPIQEYNLEGKKLFDNLIHKIKMNVTSQLLFKINYI